MLFGDQKFCILSRGVWGIRNSGSPVLFGGSEILYPLPWCVGDQKFWISCVVWGIRNSVSSPVVCGGSEILDLLCCLGDQKFCILSCGVWGIRNSETPVLFEGSEILNPLLCYFRENYKFHFQPILHSFPR